MGMSAPSRSRLRRALGYSLFALSAFVLSLYLTFDYSVLIPRITQLLHHLTGAEVSLEELHGYWLSGLELKGLTLRTPATSPASEEGGAGTSFTVDQLTFRLKLLPLLIGKRAANFSARLAGGTLQGSFAQKNQAGKLSLQIQGLVLDRLGLEPWLGPGALRFGGKLDGTVELVAAEFSNPGKWEGKAELDWAAGKIYPFQVRGVSVEEIRYDRGKLKLALKEGSAELEEFKLQGPDLPVSAQGTVSLRLPLLQSLLDIAGTVEASPAYQAKMPLLESLLPPEKKFTYTGSLESLSNLTRSQ